MVFATKCIPLHNKLITQGKMNKERTVIHLQLIENDEHHYFGSMANIYEHFTDEQLGIAYSSLRNYGLTPEHPYINKKCIIRKGLLLSKEGNRGFRKSKG